MLFDAAMNKRPQSDLPTVRTDAPSGLFLARDGTWFHDGQAVDHERLAALLRGTLWQATACSRRVDRRAETPEPVLGAQIFCTCTRFERASGVTLRDSAADRVAMARSCPMRQAADGRPVRP